MDTHLLFTPLQLRRITLPGRIIRSSTELFCSFPDGHVDPYEFEVYDRLGEQPLGAIFTAHTCVSPEGRSNLWQNALWSEEFLDDTRRIARGAQRHGVPSLLQLGHGGAKAQGNNGDRPVYTPDTMTVGQIGQVVSAFGRAALLAKTAGMRGVMLHGAHMYLLSQFFYPKFNHRTDKYGGSGCNRFRIIAEVLAEVKKTCGEEFPVFLKINGDDEFFTEEYHRDLVEALRGVADGLDAVEISGWHSAPTGVPRRPYFLENVRRLKDEVDLPLIEVGGMRSTEDMLAALEAGASAVSVCRPLMCEPDFPTRVKQEENARSACRSCNLCAKPLDKQNPVRCPFGTKGENATTR